jgi:hypothetical protein
VSSPKQDPAELYILRQIALELHGDRQGLIKECCSLALYRGRIVIRTPDNVLLEITARRLPADDPAGFPFYLLDDVQIEE